MAKCYDRSVVHLETMRVSISCLNALSEDEGVGQLDDAKENTLSVCFVLWYVLQFQLKRVVILPFLASCRYTPRDKE